MACSQRRGKIGTYCIKQEGCVPSDAYTLPAEPTVANENARLFVIDIG